MTTITRPSFETVAVGDALPAASFAVRRADLVRYAGASGDFNVIHWSDRQARDVGLPGVIAHGMFTMATAGRFVSDWCGDPGAVVALDVRFSSMLEVPDDDLGAALDVTGTVSGTDVSARTVTISITATVDGRKVLSKAVATVRLS